MVRTARGAMLGAAAVAALLSGRAALLALGIVVGIAAAGDLFRAARARGIAGLPVVGFAGIVALLVLAHARGERAPASFPVVIAITLILAFGAMLVRAGRADATRSIAYTFLSVLLVGLLGAYVIALRSAQDGFRLVLVLLAMASANEVGAALGDRARGRHPVAASVGTSRTWEGVAAGALATIVVGAVAAAALDPPFSVTNAAVLAILVALVEPVGDVVLAVVEGDRAGRATPSVRGGVLDQIDGILLAAPVFFYSFRVLER